MRNLLLLLTLIGCGDNNPPQTPRVQVESHDDFPEYKEGLAVWSHLGFSEGSEGVDCDKYWYENGQVDCTITVGIYREPNLRERYGADGLADRYSRTIIIDSRYSGGTLVHLAAHELGHILLDTGTHLKPPKVGVMASGTALIVATDDDYELACESIGVCVSQ